MITINYTKTLTGKEFAVPTEHFEISGRIFLDAASGEADSLNASIKRNGLSIGQVRLQNGVLTYRYDDYLSSSELDEVVDAANEILSDSTTNSQP